MKITVGSEKELAAAIAGAEAPLNIAGGGTLGLAAQDAGDLLSTAGMSGISVYEPGALTIVAGAGTPVEEIERGLASEGQRLAFEPMDYRGLLGTTGTPTIGGVVAANVSGPRRIQAGACRDFLLGVRFVDGRGNVVKNGGRVMKNVTGYDLVKLAAGSFGTLGVISEVALKVLPETEVRAVLLIEGLDDARAVQAMIQALGTPYEVTGAAHTPKGLDGAPVTMIRLEGFADSVKMRAEKLRLELSDFGDMSIETNASRTAAGWRWVRDVQAFEGSEGDIWRISVKPTDGPVIGTELRKQFGATLLYDWGGGLVWALVPEGSNVRAHFGAVRGHATLIKASGPVKQKLGVFHSSGPVLDRLAADLRKKFDPRGIFNPGLMTTGGA